jgi:hypothetical protein
MSIKGVCDCHFVIAGYNQAAVRELDAVTGAGCVPGPIRRLCRRRDFFERRPGRSIVAAMCSPHSAGTFRTGISFDGSEGTRACSCREQGSYEARLLASSSGCSGQTVIGSVVHLSLLFA